MDCRYSIRMIRHAQKPSLDISLDLCYLRRFHYPNCFLSNQLQQKHQANGAKKEKRERKENI